MESWLQFKDNQKHQSQIRAKDITYKRIGKEATPTKARPKIITYTTQKQLDFLKYYGVVEFYFLKKEFPDFTPLDLKLFFFLYTEPPFTKVDFLDFCEMLKWNKRRLKEWVDKGHIVEYTGGMKKIVGKPRKKRKRSMLKIKKKRPYTVARSKSKLYKISNPMKLKIKRFYDTLMLRYEIIEDPSKNPLFKIDRTYQEKRFGKKVTQMNKDRDKYFNSKDKHPKTKDDIQDVTKVDFFEFAKEYNENNKEVIPNVTGMKKYK